MLHDSQSCKKRSHLLQSCGSTAVLGDTASLTVPGGQQFYFLNFLKIKNAVRKLLIHLLSLCSKYFMIRGPDISVLAKLSSKAESRTFPAFDEGFAKTEISGP